MNINFQTITSQKSDQNTIGAGMEAFNTNRTGTGKSGSVSSSTYVANLDTSIFSNDAYAQHAKSADDISAMAQNMDVMTQHNYMALLSNTLSEEDFAKACKDGFDIKNTDSAETVTILDKIKSVLLESGTAITGYNDDISTEKLAKITGSQGFAVAIQKSFHENDIPVTAENAKSAAIAYSEISDIQGLDDSAKKYLVLNNMAPTIENIYFAAHSTNGQNVASRGYYATDAGGYYAQKADSIDWNQLKGQLDKIITEAGLDTSKEVRDEAKWIIEQGIPLTADNLDKVNTINSISFPISEELGAKSISAAILDGKKPTMANLADPVSNYRKAYEIKENTDKISDEDIKNTIESGKEINLRNLIQASTNSDFASEVQYEGRETKFVQARLMLEEVRLRMTVEANKQLLDSGFSIDTAPMENLIERLKTIMGQMADESAGGAIDEITGVTPQNRNYIISATLSRVSVISKGPIDVSGALLDGLETASLSEISATSRSIELKYRQAGQEYESLMTKPRSDLGDNIKKAFRNVDDILEDLNLEQNEDNRRAIRILGYNSMEINKENFEKVRGWDQLLKTTVERLKPGAVLDLVKQGQNPLNMTIEELAQNLDSNMTGSENGSENGNKKSDEKYSKFIFKLEHKKEITKEEKASFIGIYRLFHTLKAGDYQAIGSVLKSGLDMTLGNLLTATRTQSKSRKGLDYTVDDSFGGLETAQEQRSLKIDEQISSAFKYYSAKADIVYENLEPEKLLTANPGENTLLPELAQQLQSAELDEQLEREYYSQQVRQIRDTASMKAVNPAVDELSSLNAEITYNNIEAMISNRRDRRAEGIWRKTEDMIGEVAEKEQTLLVEALDQDGYEDLYQASLNSISDKLADLLMSEEDTFIDVRAISLMQKQLSVMSYSSERGSFDVPVEIDGQKISMHVTLKSDDSMNSRMEASVQTYEFGLITASLYEKNGIISGMLTTTNGQSSEETEYLESVRSKMCVKLAERLRDFGVGQDKIAILYHAQTPPISVGAANATATDGITKNITDTRTLLTMAKAFIEAL